MVQMPALTAARSPVSRNELMPAHKTKCRPQTPAESMARVLAGSIAPSARMDPRGKIRSKS